MGAGDIVGLSGWRATAQRIGNPLDWPTTGKCALLGAINMLLYAGNAGQLQKFSADPTLAPFLDPAFLKVHVIGLWAVCAGWGVILLAGIALRKSRPESRALMYSTVALYCIDNTLAVYVVGPFTSPMVMLIFGAPLIAFVLFEQRVAFAGVAVVYLVLGSTILAERAGWIPYAPLLAYPPYENGRPMDQWAAAMGMQIFALLTLNILLVAYIVAQWRDRETKLAQAYSDLHDTQAQLVRAESLASIGSLVTGAAHELRNPLGSSSAMLQSLAEDLESPAVIADEEQRSDAMQTLAFARQGQGRAQAIVDRLYDLSEQLGGSDTSVPLSRVMDYLRSRYSEIEFADESCGLDPPVPERACRIVLDNLIANALASGSIAPARVSAVVMQDELCWEVRDEGRGIATGHHAEIFRPFFTGQKAGQGHGVGLGLYLVHQLVTRLSGQIELVSAPGRGTSVRVRLPLQT